MHLIIIAVIITSLFVLTQTQHAVIGSYGEINATLCGLTKQSMKVSDKCYKWHKNTMSAMSAARDATKGEAPWTVAIRGVRRGINSKGERFDELNVIPGYEIFAVKDGPIIREHYSDIRVIKRFPDYNITQMDPAYDLALVSLSRNLSALTINKGQSYSLNTICLPEKNIENAGNEYVMIAGWGRTMEQGVGLQIGYRTAGPPDPFSIYAFYAPKVFFHKPVNQTNLLCIGDSGGAIWQYVNGRAVLIGIQRGFVPIGTRDKYGCHKDPGIGVGIRISYYIDWILKTIRNNP